MSFLKTLQRTSFKQIAALTLVAGLVLATPVTVWVSQQETKLASQAFFEKPDPIVPVEKHGNPPKDQPQISLVWPFLGKPGDAVLIEGKNFGDNPKNRKIVVNNKQVPEEYIHKWEPNLIEFLVPEGAKSGNIYLEAGGKRADWKYFFTVYYLDTQVQVTEKDDIVDVLKANPKNKVEIFFSDGEKIESDKMENIKVPGDKTIVSVIVKNSSGNPIPFFVEPEEFGF